MKGLAMKVRPEASTSSSAPSERRGRKGRRLLATAGLAGFAALGAGCGWTSTANADVSNTYVAIANNGHGQILVTDESPDGWLKDNRYGWKGTTLNQDLLAALATGKLSVLQPEQVDVLCKPNGKSCGEGTVFTTTPTSNGPTKWYKWSNIQVGSDVPKGQEVQKGHDYYKYAGSLSIDQAVHLSDVAEGGHTDSINAALKDADLGDFHGVRQLTFLYADPAEKRVDCDALARYLRLNDSRVSFLARSNDYGFNPSGTGTFDPNRIYLLEWMDGTAVPAS